MVLQEKKKRKTTMKTSISCCVRETKSNYSNDTRAFNIIIYLIIHQTSKKFRKINK